MLANFTANAGQILKRKKLSPIRNFKGRITNPLLTSLPFDANLEMMHDVYMA
jgi:hypothetical protein